MCWQRCLKLPDCKVCPFNRIFPVVGVSAPTNSLASVDLPEPVSPTMAKVLYA